MAAQTPTTVPDKIRAGETLTFAQSFSDYPAPAWSITFSFRALAGTKIDFTSTANGTGNLLSVPFASTAAWLPAIYSGVGIITDGTTATQIWAGQLEVLPNLAAMDEGADTRTQNRRTLDNINAVIEKRAVSTVLISMVEGTELRRIPHAELLDLQARYQVKVRNEEIALLQAQGKPTGRTVFAAFTRPK